MRFADFLGDLLDFAKRDEKGNIILPGGINDSAKYRLNVEELALFSVIDLIASAGSLCEWRTYRSGERTYGDVWYSWNLSRIENQTS